MKEYRNVYCLKTNVRLENFLNPQILGHAYKKLTLLRTITGAYLLQFLLMFLKQNFNEMYHTF